MTKILAATPWPVGLAGTAALPSRRRRGALRTATALAALGFSAGPVSVSSPA